jgi:uncharacterized membrane protein YkvI
MKNKRILTAQVAVTYIGTIVGAGFASGQGILQFFTAYGSAGLLGIGLAAILFVWLGARMMLISARIGAYSYQELNHYLFGPVFGKIADFLTFVILFGSTAVMVAGIGSIFEEQLGLSYQWGIAATVILSYVVMRKEMKGILAVNSIVVPMMFLFTAIVAWHTIKAGDFTVWQAVSGHPGWRWPVSALSYAALNIVMVQAVLVPLGSEIKDEAVLKWGGIWGGAGLGFMLAVTHFALLGRMPGILDYAIPMAEVIRSFGTAVHILFIAVIYGEIFTTLVGNVFGMARQVEGVVKIPNSLIVIAILLSCILIGQIGFSPLLAYLYPLFGYVGFALLLFLVFKRRT